MHWLVQNNLYSEEGFDKIISALSRFDLPFYVVKCVPFTGEIVAEDSDPLPSEILDAKVPVIVMGSYSLARTAQKRGWKPGAFTDNLDFRIQREHWGDEMLNCDAELHTFATVPEQIEPFFFRPVFDTKAFTGLVTDYPSYIEWRDSLLRLPETADPEYDWEAVSVLTPSTPVMVCKKKQIYTETRIWIVKQPSYGMKAVTASQYKLGSIKRYEEVRGTRFDTDILEYAEDMAEAWSPNDAYVMDVAETPDGFKIIEVNNLNSAGFYRGDMNLLVQALERLQENA